MTREYDLVILGGGSGGYVAAIRASQLGMRVAVVEKEKLGGTCLHKGCIPTKAFLRSAEVYQQTKKANEFGIHAENIQLNFLEVQKRKNNIIERLYHGVQGLMKQGKIDVYNGFGRLLGPSIFSPIPGSVSIEYSDGRDHTILTSENVLISTGTRPKMFNQSDFDKDFIISSDEALEMESLPQSIIIIGGGVIGIEWASMLADFNVNVTVIEQSDDILPSFDRTVVMHARRALEKKGIKFFTNAIVDPNSIRTENDHITVEFEHQDQKTVESANKLLVSIGRVANLENIGIENTSIKTDNGFIQVNEFYQTEEKHIYAVGDVIGGMQLAHVASHEGIIAVEHMASKNPIPLQYEHIPYCVYSSPEIASIGLSEKEAKDEGIEIKIGTFPFQANGKALVNGEADGFVKIISHKETEDIIGIHMIGPHVTDMISEGGLAKVLDATAWELTQNIYPHPSLSEVIGEAAMAVEGKAIHV